MNKLKQLKDEAQEDFDELFILTGHNSVDYYDYFAENVNPDNVRDFIDSLITKAYEVGKEEAIKSISREYGWEESQKYYEGKLLNKE